MVCGRVLSQYVNFSALTGVGPVRFGTFTRGEINGVVAFRFGVLGVGALGVFAGSIALKLESVVGVLGGFIILKVAGL